MSRTESKQRRGTRRSHWSRTQLDELVARATVDAFGESEQRTGLFAMLEEHLELPFAARVLGVHVMVEAIDLTRAGEIVAICRRGHARQRVPILELPLPTPPPGGAEWIEAYRHWASAS